MSLFKKGIENVFQIFLHGLVQILKSQLHRDSMRGGSRRFRNSHLRGTLHLWIPLFLTTASLSSTFPCLVCQDLRKGCRRKRGEKKLGETLDLPQTSRANPVQCCITHQKKEFSIERGDFDTEGGRRRFQALVMPHKWNDTRERTRNGKVRLPVATLAVCLAVSLVSFLHKQEVSQTASLVYSETNDTCCLRDFCRCFMLLRKRNQRYSETNSKSRKQDKQKVSFVPFVLFARLSVCLASIFGLVFATIWNMKYLGSRTLQRTERGSYWRVGLLTRSS